MGEFVSLVSGHGFVLALIKSTKLVISLSECFIVAVMHGKK
jgi:hypothetical protein